MGIGFYERANQGLGYVPNSPHICITTAFLEQRVADIGVISMIS